MERMTPELRAEIKTAPLDKWMVPPLLRELEAVEADLKQYKQDALEANDQFEMQDRNERQLRKELLESQARELNYHGVVAHVRRMFDGGQSRELNLLFERARGTQLPPIAALITKLVGALEELSSHRNYFDASGSLQISPEAAIAKAALDATAEQRKALGL